MWNTKFQPCSSKEKLRNFPISLPVAVASCEGQQRHSWPIGGSRCRPPTPPRCRNCKTSCHSGCRRCWMLISGSRTFSGRAGSRGQWPRRLRGWPSWRPLFWVSLAPADAVQQTLPTECVHKFAGIVECCLNEFNRI